jgi:hypothetical protein
MWSRKLRHQAQQLTSARRAGDRGYAHVRSPPSLSYEAARTEYYAGEASPHIREDDSVVFARGICVSADAGPASPAHIGSEISYSWHKGTGDRTSPCAAGTIYRRGLVEISGFRRKERSWTRLKREHRAQTGKKTCLQVSLGRVVVVMSAADIKSRDSSQEKGTTARSGAG